MSLTDKEEWLKKWRHIYVLIKSKKDEGKIIIPFSRSHREESALAGALADPILNVCNELCEKEFLNSSRIFTLQFKEYLQKQIFQKTVKNIDFKDVTKAYKHINISAESRYIEGIRQTRKEAERNLSELTKRWISAKEEGKSFDDYIDEEFSGYTRVIERAVIHYISYSVFGIPHKDIEEVPDEYIQLIDEILRCEEISHIPVLNRLRTVCYILRDPNIKNHVPCVALSLKMWSERARKLSPKDLYNSLPEGSDFADIDIISHFAPYCDVMLIDHNWFSLINMDPLQSEFIKLPTKFYSMKEIDKVERHLIGC